MPEYARVLLDQSAGKPLDYHIPPELVGKVRAGSRVRVALRTRVILATVVSIHGETEARGVRDLAELLNDEALVRPALLRLAQWMADYYGCPEEAAMRAVLPVVIRKAEVTHKEQFFIELVHRPDAGLRAD